MMTRCVKDIVIIVTVESEIRSFLGETGNLPLSRYAVKSDARKISGNYKFPIAQRLYADGGASSSAFLMQLQADLLGIDVVCEAIPESSAVGAAYFGGRHTGFYRSLDELTDLSGDSVTYHPGLRTPEELARMTGGWRRAVRSVLENRPDNT